MLSCKQAWLWFWAYERLINVNLTKQFKRRSLGMLQGHPQLCVLFSVFQVAKAWREFVTTPCRSRRYVGWKASKCTSGMWSPQKKKGANKKNKPLMMWVSCFNLLIFTKTSQNIYVIFTSFGSLKVQEIGLPCIQFMLSLRHHSLASRARKIVWENAGVPSSYHMLWGRNSIMKQILSLLKFQYQYQWL